MAAYQAECASVVESYEGYVSDFRGDGIVIYFGFPNAREDDVIRAAFCALEIVERVQKLNIKFVERLQVRVGIATGLVVVGDKLQAGLAEVTVATGEAPYLAARLQALASPNEIMISRSTFERLQQMFNCSYAGAHTLKGFSRRSACLETRPAVYDAGHFQRSLRERRCLDRADSGVVKPE